MSYINPEFKLVKTNDRFISLLYQDKTSKSQGIDKTVITDEIKDYMIMRDIDGEYKLKNIAQIKFADNVLSLAALPDNKRLIIDEEGNLKIES